MKLGFVEDFTSNVVLDQELTLNSKLGIALNSGVYPSITLDNLLQFLPMPKDVYKSFNVAKTYNNFSESRNNDDVAIYQGQYFQCIKDGTIGESPDESENWIVTNLESQLLKGWINSVKDRIYSDLRLSKRLINSQLLYEIGTREIDLSENYSAWIFEAKGSDYTTITINEISLQTKLNEGEEFVPLYIINQGQLVDTIELHPDGRLKFEKLNFSFSGVGQWIFAFDSRKVIVNGGYIDSHKYDGIVCYSATGRGETPESAEWSYSNSGNGLGFNITVSLESKNYIENNFHNLESLIKATFEYSTLQMFITNANNRSNRNEKIQLDKQMLMFQTTEITSNTVCKNYLDELKHAKKIINKTFDTQLGSSDDFEVEVSSI